MSKHGNAGVLPPLPEYDWDKAHEALESMDDYARMDKGVAPHGPYAVLRDLLTKAKGWREDAEALRQSQSLPAGAVAVVKDLLGREMTSWCHANERDKEIARLALSTFGAKLNRELEAIQADAREKGEDPVAWRIVGGSGELACFETESDKAAAWNGYYTAIPMYDHPATQPAQASEAVLSEVERKSLEGMLSGLEYEAGDVHDLPPTDDEDAFWSYHQWHAITKLLATSSQETASE